MAALIVATLLVLQNLFAVYVGNFAHYNAIYGSFGAVIVFMFFVYLAAELFRLGAEIASEWPKVRRELERGEPPQDTLPPTKQLKAALRGMWVHDHQRARAHETREDETR